ncbi:MAG: prolyl oligopeptidase family serine peptidase [Acidobacteriota bacterium]|nr:prolyl oligopeptidase family serine peptidase [Acidobacteriota bacterium]
MKPFALLLAVCMSILAATIPAPPKTPIKNVTDTLHGVSITDPYRWLEDQNSPETRAWIDSQIEYTKSLLDPLPGRERLHKRVEDLAKVEVMSAPVKRGNRYFFTKRMPNQNQAVLYMRSGFAGQDQALVDPNPLTPDQTSSAHIEGVSRDGSLLAYGLRSGGEDEITLHLMDTATRADRPDRLERARIMNVALMPDNKSFYYSKSLKEGPRVYRHQMGTDPSKDPLIFGEKFGPTDIVGCNVSESGKYLLLLVYHGSAAIKTEVYFQDLRANGPITPLVNDIEARFLPEFAGDRVFIMTNWKAPNSRVLLADLANPSREHWREVVPEGSSVLESIDTVGGKLAATYLENVISKIRLYDESGKLLREMKLPGIGTVPGLHGKWEDDETFFEFTSFVEPGTIYRYRIAEDKRDVWFQRTSSLDPASVDTKQVWFKSKDGTKIPMFVMTPRGAKLDKHQPVILTGYGGFNLSMTPHYTVEGAAWLQSGGTYAVVNLRGGSEFGEKWHRAGMLANKQNVFDDFIGAAQYLIAEGYTSPARLAIRGGSNGGLLVGAAITQRPDLFKAAVCAVPLLDMIRFQNFKVAKYWTSEYGSSDDPEQFKYIYKYSPYHHVEKGAKYPAVMLVTGDSDTRVDPLHARKMTALLQASTTSGLPVVLHYDKKAGHSGGLPISKQVDDTTDQLSFLAWQLGVKL